MNVDPLDLLLPRPVRARRYDGAWSAAAGTVTGHLQADDPVSRTAFERLRHHLEEPVGDRPRLELRSTAAATGADLRLAVTGSGAPESYRLVVSPAGINLEGADPAGLLHATATLVQWLRVAARPAAGQGRLHLPAVEVEDRPAVRHRGFMLDVSRDKVPRMETLLDLVELLSGFKINELQLYMEHTFAYAGHEAVWRDASPFTPREIRDLDAFCRARAMELVPNQNSFGHFHRWLVHPEYRPLAECPEGVEHPWALGTEPFSLCATDPRSLELLEDLYDQLLPHFTSRRFNVGLDESFDLGRCRTREICEERGRHRVYLDFLQAVHRRVRERGRRMEFWADIVLEEPEVIPELPPDAVALAWGYEAGHPFLENGRAFADSGLEYHVCPGTSSWASIAGRTSNALTNLEKAAVAGRETGARGYLVTDWGDYGHLQPLPVSYPGLAAGAAAAWNPDRPVGRDEVATLLDAHVFREAAGGGTSSAGTVTAELGDTYLHAGGRNVNGTALFFLLLRPGQALDQGRFESLTAAGLEAARDHVEGQLAALAGSRMARPDREEVRDELRWAGEALHFACDLGLARLAAGRAEPLESLPAATRGGLAARLEELLGRRRQLWLARNRPGGLQHAFAYLAPLRRALQDR